VNLENKNLFTLFAGIALLVSVVWLSQTLSAQQPTTAPAPTAAPAAAAPKTMTPADAAAAAPAARSMTLWQWFVIGGWCMWPLLACSVAGIGLVIRNELALRRNTLLRPDLMPQFETHLRNFDIPSARQVCQENPTLLTNILDVALERAQVVGFDVDMMEEAMEEASTEQMAQYLIPINLVNTIAVVAPMIGLLGTVSGMIKAFFGIGMGGMGKPEMLANNIGEALITTEAGLVIAIPAMAYYFYCKSKFVSTVATASKNVGLLMDSVRQRIAQAHAEQQQEAGAAR